MNATMLSKLHAIQQEILDEFVRICKKNNLTYFLIGGTLLGAVRHQGFIPWDDDLDVAMFRKDYDTLISCIEKDLQKDKYELHYITTDRRYWLCFAKIRKKGTIYAQKNQSLQDKCGVWIDVFPLDNADAPRKKDTQFNKVRHAQRVNELIQYRFARYPLSGMRTTMKVLYVLSRPMSIRTLARLSHRLMTFNKNDCSEYVVNIGSQYGYQKQLMPRDYYVPVKELIFEGKSYAVPNQYDKVLRSIYGEYMVLPPEDKRVTHDPQYIDLGE